MVVVFLSASLIIQNFTPLSHNGLIKLLFKHHQNGIWMVTSQTTEIKNTCPHCDKEFIQTTSVGWKSLSENLTKEGLSEIYHQNEPTKEGELLVFPGEPQSRPHQ